ncbi:MAG: VOC family protein [Gemmatimonadetes bacterium]|nr:VOC family protein [Gemmatimonadota bacterium]
MPTPSPTPATIPRAIGQVAVNTHDLPRAVAFYRDVLGLPFLFEFPGLAFFMCGTVRLMLSPPESPDYDHPGSVLYLQVDDIDGAFARMRGAGAAFDGEPHVVHRAESYHLWMAFLHDPDGNPLALMQEKPPTA